MNPVPLHINVNAWNTLKFIILQVIVSWLFSDVWYRFVSCRAGRLLVQNNTVTILSTNLGRLTPANVIHDRRSSKLFDRAPARVLILLVNVIVVAFSLLTEFGSDSVNRESMEYLEIAGRHSIMRSQTLWNKFILDKNKVPGFTIDQKLLQSAYLSFRPYSDNTTNMPNFVFREHLVHQKTGFSLIRNKSNDLMLSNVCGLDVVQGASECASHIQRTIGIPFSTSDNHTSALVFDVTHKFDLDVPEISGMASLDKYVGVRLMRIYINGTTRGTTVPEPVNLTSLNITGACSGESGKNKRNIIPKIYGSLKICVLRDNYGNTFVIHRSSFGTYSGRLVNNLTIGDWTMQGSAVVLSASSLDVLTFRTHEAPEPPFALACTLRLVGIMTNRDMQRLRRLPIGLTLRTSLLLRVLGVIGEYGEIRRVRIKHKDTVAAVNMLFFIGVALLFSVILALVVAQVAWRSPPSIAPPIDMLAALHALKDVACECESEGASACDVLSLPTFALKNGQMSVACKAATGDAESRGGISAVIGETDESSPNAPNRVDDEGTNEISIHAETQHY